MPLFRGLGLTKLFSNPDNLWRMQNLHCPNIGLLVFRSGVNDSEVAACMIATSLDDET